MSRQADEDPEGFRREVGKRFDWIKPYTRVKDVSFALDDLHIRCCDENGFYWITGRVDDVIIATSDHLQWAPGLPKTRSGKIMRLILRKIAANEHDQLGDN